MHRKKWRVRMHQALITSTKFRRLDLLLDTQSIADKRLSFDVGVGSSDAFQTAVTVSPSTFTTPLACNSPRYLRISCVRSPESMFAAARMARA